MPNVRIVADSGCDLPPSLVDQYSITIIPVFVRFGEEMISSDDLTNDEFWRRARVIVAGSGHVFAGARYFLQGVSKARGRRAATSSA